MLLLAAGEYFKYSVNHSVDPLNLIQVFVEPDMMLPAGQPRAVGNA